MAKLNCFHHRSTNVCKNTVKVKTTFCSNEFLLRQEKKSPKTSRPWEFRTITKLTWMQVEKSQKPMLVSTWTYLLLMVATHAPHHPSSGQTFDVCQRDACKTLKSGKKNAKRLTCLWKFFVAVTAPVNEDVHSKSHLCVFAFNETKTLGPTRVSKNSNFWFMF